MLCNAGLLNRLTLMDRRFSNRGLVVTRVSLQLGDGARRFGARCTESESSRCSCCCCGSEDGDCKDGDCVPARRAFDGSKGKGADEKVGETALQSN